MPDSLLFDSTFDTVVVGDLVVRSGARVAFGSVQGFAHYGTHPYSLTFVPFSDVEGGVPVSSFSPSFCSSTVDSPAAVVIVSTPISAASITKVYCSACCFLVSPVAHSARCRVRSVAPVARQREFAWLGDALLNFHTKALILKTNGGKMDDSLYQSLTSGLSLAGRYDSALSSGEPIPVVSTGSSDAKKATAVEAFYAVSPEYRSLFHSYSFPEFALSSVDLSTPSLPVVLSLLGFSDLDSSGLISSGV